MYHKTLGAEVLLMFNTAKYWTDKIWKSYLLSDPDRRASKHSLCVLPQSISGSEV